MKNFINFSLYGYNPLGIKNSVKRNLIASKMSIFSHVGYSKSLTTLCAHKSIMSLNIAAQHARLVFDILIISEDLR